MSGRREIAIARPSLDDAEWQALRAPLADGWLTQGPRVGEFEQAFAVRHGVAHAVATSSGTTALHLAMAALGIGPGDEVIVPSFTWVATANAVLHCGARPVLCDIDPRTFNLDPAGVADRLTAATRAILAVHLFGLCADVDALAAAAPGIPIIEDAACAAGAAYRGRPAGSLGAAAAFSFHPRKVITTGEGGMVTTADAEVAGRVRVLRNHGAEPVAGAMPRFAVPGFNHRMSDLQAAVGTVQLGKLDRFIAGRAELAAHYRDRLAGISWLHLPAVPPGYGHAWQAHVSMVDADAPLQRDDLMAALAARGIQTRPGTHAIHMLDYHREHLGHRPDDLPASRAAHERSLALPLHNAMTADDVDYVVDAIRAVS